MAVRTTRYCADRCLLKPSGHIILSPANVANITVRIVLLFAQLEYIERGIGQDPSALLHAQDGAKPDSRFMRIVQRFLIACTAILPGFFGYQIVLTAKEWMPASL